MTIDEILEFEANHYKTARNAQPPAGARPTRRGHARETISIEVDPKFAESLRSIFGYNEKKIGDFFQNAVQDELPM